MKSPFKFLDAYDRPDKDIFFGRTEEIDQLYALVFQTKLLLVYGRSGTGKTSLIQCGLANRFKSADWYEVFVRRRDNINASLHREIRRNAETPVADNLGVPDTIQSLYLDHLRPVYLIFDQFEELFILGSKAEQQEFIRTIAALVKSDVPCKIIFVMREEYIAMLYEFERAVPTLFKKRFRVEPMSHHNVQRVITGTAAAFGIGLEKGETTAQQIIENLSNHRSGVQLSYLQVYLDKLYREAMRERPDHALGKTPVVFTEQLVQHAGALGDVMADFLEEQTAAIQVHLKAKYPEVPSNGVQLLLEEFATLEGTKQPVLREELSARLQLPDDVISDCLVLLENNRILRNTEGVYELAHDTLAGRIAEKRSVERKNLLKIQKLIKDRQTSFEQTRTYLSKEELSFIGPYLQLLHLSQEESRLVKESTARAQRKQRRIVAGTLAIMVALASLAVWANNQRVDVEKSNIQIVRKNEQIGSLLKLVLRGRDHSVEGDSVENIITMLNDEQKAPVDRLIKLRAKRTEVPGGRDPLHGRMYDNLIWVDLPSFRRDAIREVKYYFPRGERLQREYLGREPSLGFAMSYRGWGSFPQIDITIRLANGDSLQREVDMHEVLGDSRE